jgi:hypothetical protein
MGPQLSEQDLATLRPEYFARIVRFRRERLAKS